MRAARAQARIAGAARRLAAALRALDARAAIVAFTVLVLIGIWTGLGWFLNEEREHDIRDAGERTADIALVVAEHLSRTLERADDALLWLGAEYLRQGARIDIPALQRTGVLASPTFNRIAIVGTDGYVLAANDLPKRVYVGDREPFRIHQARETGRAYVGFPAVGASSGKLSVHVTRRITAPGGSFAGVAAVGLSPEYFSDFYKSVSLGANGMVTIVGFDGIVRATELGSPGAPALGEDMAGTEMFRRLRKNGYTGRGDGRGGGRSGAAAQDVSSAGRDKDAGPGADKGFDNTAGRIESSHTVPGYPLVAIVGMSRESALAGYRERVGRYFFAAAAMSVLIVVLSTLLTRAFAHQLAITAALRERELRLAEAAEALRALSAHQATIKEKERARIARTLHDDLGQVLTGLKLSLSAMTLRQRPRKPASNEESARLIGMVEQAIAATRDAVTDLRPLALDQGLVAAIAWLARQFERRTGIACRLDMPVPEPVLEDRHATALFRVVQESLTNVARHAGAGAVSITLAADGGYIHLAVGDDGVGFDPAAAEGKQCFGLLGMRERIAMLGGALHIRSAAGSGTRVEVAVDQDKAA